MRTAISSTAFLVILLCALLVAPAARAADTTLRAGFPAASVWLSDATPVSGDSVKIYSVVYNSSPDPVAGNVVFTIDGKTIGSVHFTLDSGKTQIVSQWWDTTEGSHTVSAHIENATDTKTKQPVALTGNEASAATVAVAAPPPAPVALQYAATAVAAADTAIASATPVVSSIINTTEGVRQNAVAYLSSQLGLQSDASTTPIHGQVLGAETQAATSTAATTTGATGLLRTFFTGLLTIGASPTIFYPVILLIVIVLILVTVHGIARATEN